MNHSFMYLYGRNLFFLEVFLTIIFLIIVISTSASFLIILVPVVFTLFGALLWLFGALQEINK